MTKTIGQFYFSFIGPLTITIEITYRTLGITGLTNKYDIFSVLLVKPVILRRNPQCPRHSYLHPQASITISKVDSIPLGCRWSRNMLDQFHFNSIPPKKNDRKHQLSLFCEGFCNIQNISPVGGLLYALHQGFTFPNWLPNVISARFKQKLYDLHVTWILMERIDGSFSSGKKGKPWNSMYPLVMTNIAMENGPFIDGLLGFTYYKWWFSMAMLVITRGYLSLLGIPGKPTYFYNFYMKFLQGNPQKSTKFC